MGYYDGVSDGNVSGRLEGCPLVDDLGPGSITVGFSSDGRSHGEVSSNI